MFDGDLERRRRQLIPQILEQVRAVLAVLCFLDQRRRQPLDDLLGDPVILRVVLLHDDMRQLQRVAADDVRDLHVALVDVVAHALSFILPRRRLWLGVIDRGRRISRKQFEQAMLSR